MTQCKLLLWFQVRSVMRIMTSRAFLSRLTPRQHSWQKGKLPLLRPLLSASRINPILNSHGLQSLHSYRRNLTTTTTTPPTDRPPHDVGGSLEDYGPIFSEGKPLEELLAWEQQCHSLFAVLATKNIIATDELRRTVEVLTPEQYRTWSYYEKWSAAMTTLLLDKKLISHHDLRKNLLGEDVSDDEETQATPQFQVGQAVRVKSFLANQVEWRRPHIRTPGYIYGTCGEIERVCGRFGDPSFLAFGFKAPTQQLYRVRFRFQDIWPEQHEQGSHAANDDVVEVEVYENWLEKSDQPIGHDFKGAATLFDHKSGDDCIVHDHSHSHHHHHATSDDEIEPHVHEARPVVEERAILREGPPTPGQALHRALMRILTEIGIVTTDEVRSMCERMDMAGKQLLGSSLVAKAWMDPGFKERLLLDAASAASEVGISTSNPNAPTVLTVVPNTPTTHNVVVCTLCSCYPSGLLGIAPSWYKSREYRARAVREPRNVLQEFGLSLPSERKIRVHDSTADHRYLVLPERPPGTENWTEDELRQLITRDMMVGVALPKVPVQ